MSTRTKIEVYRWKSGTFDGVACNVVFALNAAGRVVEIETRQDDNNTEWWMVLKAVVPLPARVRAVLPKPVAKKD